MSISLDELRGGTGKKEELAPVSMAELGHTTENSTPTTITNSEDFLGQQFGKLNDLVDRAKTQYEERAKETESVDEEQNMDEQLENFDPNATGPVATVDINSTEPIADPTPTPISIMPSHIESKINADMDKMDSEDRPASVETKEEKDAKTEKEFNDLMSSEDNELMDILNDADENEEVSSDDSDSEGESISKEQEDKLFDQYKSQVRDAIKDKHPTLDTKSFKVSRKHISMTALLKKKEPDKKIADWVLPTAGKSFSMTEFSGIDIQRINPQNRSRNRINTVKDMYRTMYNHIVGASETGFESWLRSVPFRDSDQLYFAVHKATFGEANFVTYQCEDAKCKKVFMQECPIESMYEVDDDYKDTFDKILNKDTSFENAIDTEIVPISDRFAIGLVEPSIYSVDIESIMIDEEMRNKYARIINLLPFIDCIYYIDIENQEFVPVDEKPVANDFAKTVKHRLAIYYNILNTLDNDQMAVITAHTVNYNEKKSPIRFVIPECTCPECGRTINKEYVSAANILFSRAQSSLLANLSGK